MFVPSVCFNRLGVFIFLFKRFRSMAVRNLFQGETPDGVDTEGRLHGKAL